MTSQAIPLRDREISQYEQRNTLDVACQGRWCCRMQLAWYHPPPIATVLRRGNRSRSRHRPMRSDNVHAVHTVEVVNGPKNEPLPGHHREPLPLRNRAVDRVGRSLTKVWPPSGHDLGKSQLGGHTSNRSTRCEKTQYSVFFSPGVGIGYLPSASACTGAGESMVNLSTPGAYSSSELRISSYVISSPV